MTSGGTEFHLPTGEEIDDGWDDFDVEDEGDEEPANAAVAMPLQTADGWGDDANFFDEEEEEDGGGGNQEIKEMANDKEDCPKSSQSSAIAVVQASASADNAWEADNDLTFDSENDETPQSRHLPTISPAPTSRTLQDLENYLQLLPHLKNSVAAVLQTEYNNPQKALEIIQYFAERPGLVDYTIEKELPRMEYVIIEQNGMPLQEKEKIAAWMMQAGAQGSLLPRCANQSLLADLLQAMTGPDLLVRPQFMATVIARHCSFVIDTLQETVVVKANLELSIPTEQGRWKVADLSVFGQLAVPPALPSIMYRVDVVTPAKQNDEWREQLRSATRMIEDMHIPENLVLHDSHQQGAGGMDFRDAFLQQSQNLFQNSTVGLRSALKEIDSVAGISHKLSKLPGFLPQDVMEAAEHEQAQGPERQSNPQQRPTSILGGFLSSGLTRLAQTVVLPEEDPEYYQQWQKGQQQQQQQQQHSDVRHAPQLYNRTDQAPVPTHRPPQPLHLHQRVDESTRLPNHKDTPEPDLRQSHRVGDFDMATKRPLFSASHKAKVNGDETKTSSGNMMGTWNDDVDPAHPLMGPVDVQESVADGWDVDDAAMFSPDELAVMESDSPWERNTRPHESETQPFSRPSVAGGGTNSFSNVVTDDSDGGVPLHDPVSGNAVPTRKRWVNPRPGPRTLEFYMQGH